MWWKRKAEPVVFNLPSDFNELLKVVRIGLVAYLTGKEGDLRKLKLEILRPILEEQWKEKSAEEAEKINRALESKGEKIRKAWEGYKEDLLEAEKTGKPTETIKAKLEVLNKLMEGVE